MRARSPRIGPDGKALPPTVDDLLPGEDRYRFLGLLARRTPPGIAAREFDLTGSQIRSLRRRDPEFDAECSDAWGEGENYYEERLSVEARLRAIEGKSDRILEVELATHGGPKYAHLRRDRMRVEGRMEHALVVDPAKLSLLSESELRAFERALAKLSDDVIDGEAVELPAEIEAGPADSG